MGDITAIILTKNEEKNIVECISSIAGLAKRIVVVDSGSTDSTIELARSKGAEVLIHPMENFTQSKQMKYALENLDIESGWVLRLDADERFTEASRAELLKLTEENRNTDVNGIVLRFEVSFMGKKLRHGGIYPMRKMFCFKPGKAHMEERAMDEHMRLDAGRMVEMKNDCEHHDYKNISEWIDKHNRYSDRETEDYFSQFGKAVCLDGMNRTPKIRRFLKMKVYYRLPSGLRAKLYYFYRYYILLGFLDGREGKMFAFMQAYWYRMLVDAKIYERRKLETDTDK